ncbi:nitronate monooxygenase [Reyranella sp.]|jgi:NAD(P)H-dependent flavin oxidoreductase YrpB (nitropropane dioxygenase family)|uniref:nitronate monooxygenase n=1 Tax=Reyranella sp. TaxID=1929291 RepID=UPI00086C29AA|nr:nitronate monooxygenase [Reyranella sp.]ODT14292.1 MAG: monooxygenase [Kaistia sp. SCN 65-12]TAJ81366.1 MAG: nitronate monooxygenase [Reyranella sp.]
MNNELCKKLGIEFPLFAFSHCRDVVAEVTNAGGFGVLGAVGLTPETLEIQLNWIDEKVKGKPYGVDLLIPENMLDREAQTTDEELKAHIPPEHKKFIEDLLRRNQIDPSDLWDRTYDDRDSSIMRPEGAKKMLEVAFRHPIKMFVNALGVPPADIIEEAHNRGILVGALTGSKRHAIKHAEAGVDVLVAAGGEAGGHCGEISTIVLVPEVLEAIKDYDNMHVLAAGGIATGRQMAACMAMGASGVWCGSVWLTTAEAETTPTVKEKMLKATSANTVRSRSRTGKPTRQLQSAWTDAWSSKDAPEPLPMPLQGILSRPAMAKVDKLAESGHEGAKEIASYFVGQCVGLMNEQQSTRSVVYEFMRDYAKAVERLSNTLAE